MRYLSILLALALGVANAAPDERAAIIARSSASTDCFTTTSSQSCASRTTVTRTTPCTTTSVVYKTTVTSTPVPRTTTVTDTAVYTLPGPSFTVSSVTTITERRTTTFTSTVTTTRTFTSTVRTSTVEAPYLQPVQDSVPGATYDGSGGPDPISGRDVLSWEDILARDALPQEGLLARAADYYLCVTCTQKVPSAKCTTVKSTATSTVVASTPVVTRTITITSTTTYHPTATSIKTVYTTTTITAAPTTKTQTASTTITKSSITTTVYAACATSNLANKYHSLNIGNATLISGNYDGSIDSYATSAYDCCVQAFTTNATRLAAQTFYYVTNGSTAVFGGGNNCRVNLPGTCTDQQRSSTWAFEQSAGGDFTVGNGYCGEWVSPNSG